ncbi:MAG TPA: LacI family DNA-binding transcriptional regulator [Gammaproteobacteria bacterium]|nr:LacI family DNA-binding transcriptional regulator [Gammaproteobacteria bacterium]
MSIATIKDVARHAQVSIKTVSRVINHEPSVHQNTRARVQKAIEELRYRPDLSARSLRSAKTFAIGLVYDNPNAHYVISLQTGLLTVCRETGFGLQIHPCDSSKSGLARELAELVQRSHLAGLVLAPPMSEDMRLIKALHAHKIPLVRIISARKDPEDGYPCVFIDDRDAAHDITEHLIQLGHTRIGFLWGGKRHLSSPERYQGYVDALNAYGIKLDKNLIVAGDYSFDDGFRGARKLLALKSPPTAIFGSNDEIAAGVLAAARVAGLNVPYDLSIAGFEDSPFSRQSWPALTTAHQSVETVALHAGRLLIEQLRGNAEGARNKGFSPDLVVRGSTAPPGVKPPASKL